MLSSTKAEGFPYVLLGYFVQLAQLYRLFAVQVSSTWCRMALESVKAPNVSWCTLKAIQVKQYQQSMPIVNAAFDKITRNILESCQERLKSPEPLRPINHTHGRCRTMYDCWMCDLESKAT